MWDTIVTFLPYVIGAAMAVAGTTIGLYFKKGKDFYLDLLTEVGEAVDELDDIPAAIEVVLADPSVANLENLKKDVLEAWDSINDIKDTVSFIWK